MQLMRTRVARASVALLTSLALVGTSAGVANASEADPVEEAVAEEIVEGEAPNESEPVVEETPAPEPVDEAPQENTDDVADEAPAADESDDTDPVVSEEATDEADDESVEEDGEVAEGDQDETDEESDDGDDGEQEPATAGPEPSTEEDEGPDSESATVEPENAQDDTRAPPASDDDGTPPVELTEEEPEELALPTARIDDPTCESPVANAVLGNLFGTVDVDLGIVVTFVDAPGDFSDTVTVGAGVSELPYGVDIPGDGTEVDIQVFDGQVLLAQARVQIDCGPSNTGIVQCDSFPCYWWVDWEVTTEVETYGVLPADIWGDGQDLLNPNVGGWNAALVDGTCGQPVQRDKYVLNDQADVDLLEGLLAAEELGRGDDSSIYYSHKWLWQPECSPPPIEPPAPVPCPAGSQQWVNPNLGNRAASRILQGQTLATGIVVGEGTLVVTEAVSWDGYEGRSSTNQVQEIWSVAVNGNTLPNSTGDIPDGVEWGQTVTDLGQIVTAGGEMIIVHTGDASSANSVVPVSFCYTVTPPEQPEPSPTIVVDELVCGVAKVTHRFGNEQGEDGSVANFNFIVDGVTTEVAIKAGEIEVFETVLPRDGTPVEIGVSDGGKPEFTQYSYEECPTAVPSAQLFDPVCDSTEAQAQLGNIGDADANLTIEVRDSETGELISSQDVVIEPGQTGVLVPVIIPDDGSNVDVRVLDGDQVLANAQMRYEECPEFAPRVEVNSPGICDNNSVRLVFINDGELAGPFNYAVGDDSGEVEVPAGETRTIEVLIPFNVPVDVAVTAESMQDYEETVTATECPMPDPSVDAEGPIECGVSRTYFDLVNDGDADALFTYEIGTNTILSIDTPATVGTALAAETVAPGESERVYVDLTFGVTTSVVINSEGMETVNLSLAAERCPVTAPSGSGTLVCVPMGETSSTYNSSYTIVDPDGVVTSVTPAAGNNVPNVRTVVTIDWVNEDGVAQTPITFEVLPVASCNGSLPVTGGGTGNLITLALGLLALGAVLLLPQRRRKLALARMS